MFVCGLKEVVGQILPAAAIAPFAAAPAGAAAGQVRRQTRLGVTTMPPQTTLLQPSGAAFGTLRGRTSPCCLRESGSDPVAVSCHSYPRTSPRWQVALLHKLVL